MSKFFAAVLALSLLYPLSYAPLVSLNPSATHPRDMPFVSFYEPVDWILIDHTPLRSPLFWWARLWGVETYFETAEEMRNILRNP